MGCKSCSDVAMIMCTEVASCEVVVLDHRVTRIGVACYNQCHVASKTTTELLLIIKHPAP